MTAIFFEQNGTQYAIRNPDDMRKALGNHSFQNIVMTDESGRIVGAGDSIAALNRSIPLINTLHDSALYAGKTVPLKKSSDKKILFIKGQKTPMAKMAKSFGKSGGMLGKINRELDNLKKSLTVVVDDSPDLMARVVGLETTVVQVTDYLEALIAKGVLPEVA